MKASAPTLAIGPAIYILHENDEWVAPLRAALDERRLTHLQWHLASDTLLPQQAPEGVFYGRVSASSHLRDHGSAPEYGAAVLEWLSAAGRRVVNGARAVDLEISKARQYVSLRQHGVPVPAYEVVLGTAGALAAGSRLGYPLVVKPNRGGKGAGVRRFDSQAELARAAGDEGLESGPDNLLIIQQYIAPKDDTIVRCEFVGGDLLYAVRVDTSSGFELCPADGCEVEDAYCATSATAQFEIVPGFQPPHLPAYRQFLASNGAEIAGIELLFDAVGQAWTYDVNMNTNYNPAAEHAAHLTGTDGAGMAAVSAFLEAELHRAYPELASAA